MATVAHEQFAWTEERVALLRQRTAEGVGPSAIARELRGHNLIPTRNAVIGKLNRLGLRVGAPIKAERKRQSRKVQVKAQRAPKPRPPAQAPRCVALAPLMLAGGKTIGILDVDDSMCRYPAGDPAKSDFAFCGRRPSGERPYCIDHVRLCYEKPRKLMSESKLEAPAALGEYRRALSRLASATGYLIQNYLEDERTEQALCLDKDHWAAINLAYDTASGAMDLLKRPVATPEQSDV